VEAAEVANVAAGIEVGKLGAATVTAAEMLDYADTRRLHR
jgi:bifunctional ADP-heptose synthase (sugar kinase/adenylyltransferase)